MTNEKINLKDLNISKIEIVKLFLISIIHGIRVTNSNFEENFKLHGAVMKMYRAYPIKYTFKLRIEETFEFLRYFVDKIVYGIVSINDDFNIILNMYGYITEEQLSRNGFSKLGVAMSNYIFDVCEYRKCKTHDDKIDLYERLCEEKGIRYNKSEWESKRIMPMYKTSAQLEYEWSGLSVAH